MDIIINGETYDIGAAETLAQALERAGVATDGGGMAVAVNDEVVPRSRWNAHVLKSRDRIEVIHAVQGG
jgi:sulfur carrier protein